MNTVRVWFVRALTVMVFFILAGVAFHVGNASAEEVPGVSTEVLTEKDSYGPGEPVNVTVVVTNNGEESVTYSYRSFYATYIVGDGGGAKVFEPDIPANTVMTEVTLEPGGSQTFVLDLTEAWAQVDGGGCVVDAGTTYTIFGVLNTWDYPVISNCTDTMELQEGLLTQDTPYSIGNKTVTITAQDAGDASVEVETSTDKASYDTGERVNVTVTIRNTGAEPLELGFTSSLRVYYVVKDGQGVVIYDLKSHTCSEPLVYQLSLGPGTTATYVFTGSQTWGHVDDDGQPVARDREYSISARLNTWTSYVNDDAVVVLAGDGGNEASSLGPSTIASILVVAGASAIAVVAVALLWKRRLRPL